LNSQIEFAEGVLSLMRAHRDRLDHASERHPIVSAEPDVIRGGAPCRGR
jgi:hypothetical protein